MHAASCGDKCSFSAPAVPTTGAAAQQIAPVPMSGQLSMQDHQNYTVAEGAQVSVILKGMLGPSCDEHSYAHHKLALKIQGLHDCDFAKRGMKVETLTFHGDGTAWVNATSIFKYMYTDDRDNFALMLKRHFETCHIPHKILEVQGVRTIFLFSTVIFTGINSIPDCKPSGRTRKFWKSGTKSHLVLKTCLTWSFVLRNEVKPTSTSWT